METVDMVDPLPIYYNYSIAWRHSSTSYIDFQFVYNCFWFPLSFIQIIHNYKLTYKDHCYYYYYYYSCYGYDHTNYYYYTISTTNSASISSIFLEFFVLFFVVAVVVNVEIFDIYIC